MTTVLKFRNVSASPNDPVESWPFEGILAAVERRLSRGHGSRSSARAVSSPGTGELIVLYQEFAGRGRDARLHTVGRHLRHH
jgi:hypothetical protein